MKQQKEIIKIAASILAGAVAVMVAIGVMLNMVLHPFIIILVLIVLFGIAAIVAGVMMEFRGIIMVVASFVFGWFGFNAYYHHACGPNRSDVKVMKPMAEAISNYIVKHGIPESLKDIPGLPYELKECRKETIYGPSVKTYFTEGALWQENTEICTFKNITLRFGLTKRLKEKDADLYGTLEMDSIRNTGLWMQIQKNKNKNFYFGNMSFSGRKDGICQSWRQ